MLAYEQGFVAFVDGTLIGRVVSGRDDVIAAFTYQMSTVVPSSSLRDSSCCIFIQRLGLRVKIDDRFCVMFGDAAMFGDW